MEKKYNLKSGFRLETNVTVNGSSIPISFVGGRMKEGKIIARGHYITSDPDIQKALESSRGFNSWWELDKNTLAKMPKETETAVVSHPVETSIPEATSTEATSGKEDLSYITNYTLAKNYLLSLYPEITRAEIISADKLRAKAKEKGITFPGWV